MHRRSMPFACGLVLIAAGCGVAYAEPESIRPEVAAPATPSALPPTLTVESASDRVQELLVQQGEIRHAVGRLPSDDTPERAEQLQTLRDRKEHMVGDLEYLASALEHAGQDDPDAPPVLAEAANLIRESEVVGKVRFSRGTIARWAPASAERLEESIEDDLEELLDLLTRAR